MVSNLLEEKREVLLQCEQVRLSYSPTVGVDIWHSPFIYVWQQLVKLESNEFSEAHPSPKLLRPMDPV
jgi:hypothetical protein